MLGPFSRFMVRRLPPPGKAHADVIEELRRHSRLSAEEFDAKVPLLQQVPLERLQDLASLAPHCAAYHIDAAVGLIRPADITAPFWLLIYMSQIVQYRVGAVLWRVAVFGPYTDSFRVQFDRLMWGLMLWGLCIISGLAMSQWAQGTPLWEVALYYVCFPFVCLDKAQFAIKTLLRDPEADSWGPLSGKFEDHIEGTRAATWVLISLL